MEQLDNNDILYIAINDETEPKSVITMRSDSPIYPRHFTKRMIDWLAAALLKKIQIHDDD